MSFQKCLLAGLVTAHIAHAGPYPPAAGLTGSDAVSTDDMRIKIWASAVVIDRGPVDIDSPDGALASYGQPSLAIGPADATPDEPYPVVSLGDGGTAEITFEAPISDVPGGDFAVFENGFSASFLELCHVEASSDGIHFFRFPSTSLTSPGANPGEGGMVDPTNVHNLAGKYLAGYGTPFDLAELSRLYPEVDIQRITHLRITDVVGTNVPSQASFDASGRMIIDPYPTPYASSGFDLDAVGAFQTTPTTFAEWTLSRRYQDGDAAPSADPDHDGVPNIVAYLTGGGLPTVSLSAAMIKIGFSRLTYRRGASLKLQASSDLEHWENLAESDDSALMVALNQECSVTEQGEFKTRTEISLPGSSLYRYFRLAAHTVP